MNFKKGTQVKVLSGKDKEKMGEILVVFIILMVVAANQ